MAVPSYVHGAVQANFNNYNPNPYPISMGLLFSELWFSLATNWCHACQLPSRLLRKAIGDDSWLLPSYKRWRVKECLSLWLCFQRRPVKVLLTPGYFEHACLSKESNAGDLALDLFASCLSVCTYLSYGFISVLSKLSVLPQLEHWFVSVSLWLCLCVSFPAFFFVRLSSCSVNLLTFHWLSCCCVPRY